jgi:hypothetical protein
MDWLRAFVPAILVLTLPPAVCGQVCNVKVVTDGSPDYYDMESLIHSITSKWDTPAEKCWALFYWNHIARRQTSPMMLHGLALTDPIMQFNDYGYTMCSTIAGINCSIWDALGLPVKYWDISNHTVPEVEYDGRWHMYDGSMSAIYTLCDGKTVAGVEDIGREGACEASDGRSEPGHIARYHCLNATSANGFLTGADCPRSLDQEYRCFNPNGLKYRPYYNDWDRGHRYILNLREGEVYTRHCRRLGDSPEYYVPNNGKDPDNRFGIRGNGIRTFRPELTPNGLARSAHSATGVVAVEPAGVQPQVAGQPGVVVFKIESANIITSLSIRATFRRQSPADTNAIAVSTTNGLSWQEVWRNDNTGETPAEIALLDEVNGAYEVLVKVTLTAAERPSDSQLTGIEFQAITMLNGKTQPKLLHGKNTVYVGLGDQTESIVLWPDLRGDRYKTYVVEEQNITSKPDHPGYMGVMHAVEANREAYVVFRVDAPRDITRMRYGGRLYNRAPDSHIDFLHSFDEGKTWTKSYSLTSTAQPWDVIHYEIVDDVPQGTRSMLIKYLLNSSAAGTNACSIYGVRMEVNHRPADPGFRPLEVTFIWQEVQEDYSLVERSYTELVTEVPHRYTINVGGADHPAMESLRINLKGALPDVEYGYSDGVDAGGDRYVPRWVTYGTNLANGKPYRVSASSNDKWGAGDPEGKKLTDGVVGPPYAGGIGPSYALGWDKGAEPEITVDLGTAQQCGAFRIHLSGGWPWWDALKGEVQDRVEVLTSLDDGAYTSAGALDLDLRYKDIPVNHLLPDDETGTGPIFELIPEKPVEARYVRFKITPERSLTVSEVQVLDFIRYEPFDLRIALPDE